MIVTDSWYREQMDTIAALKAERDRAKEYAAAYFDEVTVLKTERDSLRSLLDTYDTALSRECKRLRAALDAILTNTSDGGAATCARRALEGK